MNEAPRPIIAADIVRGGWTLLVRRRVSEGNLSWQFAAGEQEPGEDRRAESDAT